MIFRSYTEGNSFLHRMNPAIKLLSLSLFLMVPTLFLDPVTPSAFLLLSLLLALILGRISPFKLLYQMTPFLVVMLGICVFSSLFYGGPKYELMLQLGPVTVYREGVAFGLSIGLRFLCVLSYSSIFVRTTDPTLLASSLIHQVHLPYRIGYTVLTAYRFIPILQRELSNIRDAHKIRGGYREGIWARLGRIRRYGIPLLSNGIRKAERMSISMDARGFGTAQDRTYYRPTSLRTSDVLFLIGSLLVIVWTLIGMSRFGLLRGFLAGVAESLVEH
jgi:energy-coupling factor transport system permease protein